MEFSFIDQEEVEFDNGQCKGRGKIVGCADTGHAVVGQSYLIQVDQSNLSLPSYFYPYSVISMHQLFIRPKQ